MRYCSSLASIPETRAVTFTRRPKPRFPMPSGFLRASSQGSRSRNSSNKRSRTRQNTAKINNRALASRGQNTSPENPKTSSGMGTSWSTLTQSSLSAYRRFSEGFPSKRSRVQSGPITGNELSPTVRHKRSIEAATQKQTGLKIESRGRKDSPGGKREQAQTHGTRPMTSEELENVLGSWSRKVGAQNRGKTS